MTSVLRSFGLVAHVDAGKTSLAERILFVAGRIHRAGEVRGDRATQLDHLPVEIKHGITVTAAATTLSWAGHALTLIDTPGHIDFTVEVERALSVLDGAVLVLDGVHGVQAQTRTVARQIDRYALPRVVFVNKCDHPAAAPDRAVASVRGALGWACALVQAPIVEDGAIVGVVDLVTRTGWSFADDGRRALARAEPIDVEAEREALVDAVSLVDAELLESALRGPVSPEALGAALRRVTVSRAFVPALIGSAVRGIGVQNLLSAVVDWMPSPEERPVAATDSRGVRAPLTADGPLAAWVFKTEDSDHGTWTWVRVFRGRLCAGATVVEGGTLREHRVRRLGRLHGGAVEPLEVAAAGEVVAVFGLDVASGVTLCDPSEPVVIGGLRVPDPVVERAIRLVHGDRNALARGLRRLVRDDPTLRLTHDDESGETRLHGMGELHLDIVAEILHDRYGCAVSLGPPQVAYRTRLVGSAEFSYTLSKQSGGPGMYAKLVGRVAPADAFVFRWAVVGGAVPAAYQRAIEEAMAEEARRGAGTGWPLVGIEVTVTDGAVHSVDSSERAFAHAAAHALRGAVADAGVERLAPVARVVLESTHGGPGALSGVVASRAGRLVDAGSDGTLARVEGILPVERLFGLAEAVRSATAGAGTFSAEPEGYEPVQAGR